MYVESCVYILYNIHLHTLCKHVCVYIYIHIQTSLVGIFVGAIKSGAPPSATTFSLL